MHKNTKFIITFIFTLLLFSPVKTFSLVEEILQTEVIASNTESSLENTMILESKIYSDDKKSTSITIKSNVQGVKIFLNSNYQGTTPLTITSLPHGTYKLHAEKDEYLPLDQAVSVEKGACLTYMINLHKTSGMMEFSLEPQNASVFIDGKKTDSSLEAVQEGLRKVEISCFGYKTWSSMIEVKKDTLTKVKVHLDFSPFAITSLSVEKESFNPRGAGSISKNTINFSLTASKAAYLIITNADGEVVWKKFYDSFSTWDNSEKWNGRSYYGMLLQDGEYTIILKTSDESRSTKVKIDSSISIPHLSSTKGGSGNGCVASAEFFPKNTWLADLTFGINSNISSMSFAGLPLTVSILTTPLKWLELSASCSSQLAAENNMNGNFNIKAGYKKNLDSAIAFNYSANIRFGLSNMPVLAPYGNDSGNGLGGGFQFGISSVNFYCGLSAQYIFRPVMGLLSSGNDSALFTGAIIQYRNQSFALCAFASISSFFGTFICQTDTLDYNVDMTRFFRVLDSGLEFNFLIPDSSVNTVFKIGTIDFANEPLYIYASAGLSILF